MCGVITRPPDGNGHNYFAAASRRNSKYRKFVPANKQPTPGFFMLPEPDLNIAVLCPENVVVNKPLLAQVESATVQVKENTLRNYCISVHLQHQCGKLTLIYKFIMIPDERKFHKSYMRLNSWIPSSSPELAPLEPTFDGRLSFLGACGHEKRMASRHYCKPTRIYFGNMEKDICFDRVQCRIWKLSARVGRWCCTSAHGCCIYTSVVKQAGNVSKKPKNNSPL